MKKYIDYTAEDFAADDHFIRWVLNPDPAVDSFWISWQAKHPQKKEAVDKARQLLLLIDFRKDHPAREAYQRVWESIEQEIEHAESNAATKVIAIHQEKNTEPALQRPFIRSGRIAASLAGVLLLSVLSWLFFLKDPTVHYTTDYGEIRTIVLPDNSVVKLNANSSLSFTADWQEDKAREVWLDGEAFFSVTHQASHQKFLVHVDALRVEVLGTEFNVSNRGEKASVVLNSGKVRLDYKKENNDEAVAAIVMEPGEMVEVSHQDKAFIKKRVDTELLTSWRHNYLIFKDAPVREVITAIEHQSGMEIILQDTALAHHRYTGTIPIDKLEVFFTTLTRSFNVNIMKNKQQIIIRKKKE